MAAPGICAGFVVPARAGKVEAATCGIVVSIIYPGNIDIQIYPGNIARSASPLGGPMYQHQPDAFTAFEGQRHLISGPIAEVVLAVKRLEQRTSEPTVIFSDATGRPIDFDLRGSDAEILARLPAMAS